jgi:hypothetical protein
VSEQTAPQPDAVPDPVPEPDPVQAGIGAFLDHFFALIGDLDDAALGERADEALADLDRAMLAAADTA